MRYILQKYQFYFQFLVYFALKNWNLKFILKKTAIGRSIKNANVNLACAICNGLTPSPNMLLPKIFAIILPEANASEANIIKIIEILKGL